MNYPELERVINVIAALRDPETGCPWDLKQTHESLLKYLIEESYEFISATEKQDDQEMQEELGDVLLQVLLHSKLAEQRSAFDIEKVAKTLADKMIHRHPHVFKDPNIAKNDKEVVQNWEQIKAKEKGLQKYFFKEDDFNMPALMASEKIGKKSKKVNFDWDNHLQVLAKVEEELQEVKDELNQDITSPKVKEEIGDLLFSVAQLARHLDIDPEDSLRQANKKFVRRFNKVEDFVRSQKKEIRDYELPELEEIWKNIKKS